MQSATLPSIDRIKKQAKQLRKATELTHMQALEAIARNHGFKTYASLQAAHKQAKAG
ncbi:glyoxalase superfamily protein [Ectopseudomonas hydrolytica]|uniref:glyoxalase superfamily protein n=1 Tax=Ectopseudomonas hydrolytica TaxID=2493633 RepID=UPI003EE09D3B